MSWKEERDALIAQTMAFVQSVTGKPADFSQFELPAVPVGTPVTPQQAAATRGAPAVARPAAVTLTEADASHADHSHANQGPNPAAIPSPDTRAREFAAPDAAPARPSMGLPERFTSIASQLDLQRDMQAEIRARVARFRAHQERFNRERQEYFSATLARLKASAEGTELPED
ncbi:hypothetical protein SSBR45G_27100 [Bradyrhizobium sp. SSBR45G]|uniref:hypothetical protein n=1 Tax=unclassified Bradyrhizobium TaxID=2631580 RepID=UPI0023429337|nr:MULTISPECIES: hypothetical protein [unclassified Bradyrhizobium]GLH77802.1 hypothetical protein SSBR45G_27100 [Bradyrhizobium sp. SSBR45G]GLH85577.1 hypothetical protein SSBR45R_30370 [Bradyrhizobium sp. SSBR45R]